MGKTKLNIILAAANWQSWFENFCKNVSYSGTPSITTFMKDFTLADFGCNAEGVKETFARVKLEWLNDYKYWTELVCVLCHKSNLWYGKGTFEEPNYYWVDENNYIKHPVNKELSELYSDLYLQAKDLFYDTYGKNNEACEYFFNVTD